MLSAVKFVRVDSAGERKKDSSGHKVKPRKGSDDSSDSERERRRKKRKKERGGKKGKRRGRRGGESEAGESESDSEDGRATRRARKREERRKRRGKWIEDVSDGSDDSEGSDEEGDEIRAGVTAGLGARSEGAGQGGQQSREAAGMEWMMRAPERPLGEARAVEEEEEEKGRKEIVLGSSARELNPYFKTGDGFPDSAAAHPAADPAAHSAAQRLGSARPAPPPGVGDGGASWRLKALRRAKEQAEREGKRLSEVVSDRWGSLSSLTARLSSARAAPAFAHKHAARDRERGVGEDRGDEGEGAKDGRGEGEREGKRSRDGEGLRIEDVKGDGGRGGEGKGWRGKEGGTRDKGSGGRGGWRQEEEREREGEGRGRRGGRDDGGEEEEDEEEERRMRGGRRGYLEGVSVGARAGMRVPQQESVSWRRRGEGGARGERGVAGDKTRAGEGGGGEGGEERKQAWKGVGAWRPGMGVGRRGGWADGVLEEAARSVNAFADDGGFLAQQLARGDVVAGPDAGGGKPLRGVGTREEARGADGRRGAAGERGRDAAGSGGAGEKAEGVTAGDGDKSDWREGGEGRASEDGGERGAGEEVGSFARGGGEGMEGGGGAAVDAGDARVQEILAGGLTANQMAAKAMRLKLMGKADEADCWQVGWAQRGWAQVGWAQVGWAQGGWAQGGWAQGGWAQRGWAQVGWAQGGWAQVGWGEWRMRAAAAKSQPPPPAPPPALLTAPATSTLEPRALGEGRGDGEGERGEGEGRREVVQLPLVDGSGRYLPAVMAAREGRDEVQAGRREKRVERYDVEGGTGQRARDCFVASFPKKVEASLLRSAHVVERGPGVVRRGDGRAKGRNGCQRAGHGKQEQQPISIASASPPIPSVPPSLDYALCSTMPFARLCPSLDYALRSTMPFARLCPSLDYALRSTMPFARLCPSLDYALRSTMPFARLCPSLDYALRSTMPFARLCPSLDYALRSTMPFARLCPSLDYALRSAMPFARLCPSLDYALRSTMRFARLYPSLDYALRSTMPFARLCPSLDYALLTGSAPAPPAGGGGGGRKKGRPSQQQREKAGQVGEFRRQAAVQQRCQQCIDSPARPRHLVVSVAAHSYLMLPPGGSLLPNHVLIVPSEVSHTVQWPHKAPLTLKTPAAVAMHARAPHSLTPSTPCHSPPRWWQHEGSMRVVEEAVWDEVHNFKKCLTRMAMATQEGAGVIFLESAMGVGGAGRQCKHCYVEAIPVPAAVMAQAPLYFKKVGPRCMARTALDEAESEWSQQHSKRIIDTRAIRGGLRSAIPPNFPYFHVEFSLQGGYCHVIDDESAFKASLGRDVIAGIMEMDPQRFGGRARARGGRGGVGSRPQEVQQSVAKFMESWKPFDWTKMLDG
ncbi:unnamed protein product [Closterium sp. Naga37s-1]|nr:unnamed protein product [Closterium sp. Naga37s-1]